MQFFYVKVANNERRICKSYLCFKKKSRERERKRKESEEKKCNVVNK